MHSIARSAGATIYAAAAYVSGGHRHAYKVHCLLSCFDSRVVNTNSAPVVRLCNASVHHIPVPARIRLPQDALRPPATTPVSASGQPGTNPLRLTGRGRSHAIRRLLFLQASSSDSKSSSLAQPPGCRRRLNELAPSVRSRAEFFLRLVLEKNKVLNLTGTFTLLSISRCCFYDERQVELWLDRYVQTRAASSDVLTAVAI